MSSALEGEASAGLRALPPQTSTRADLARTILLEAITSGHLAPGTLYSVQSLAQELGVSRTPVREALVQLSRDGVVRFERNRGVRVVVPSDQDLRDVLQIRHWLEGPAARSAAMRWTPAIYREAKDQLDTMIEAARVDDELRFLHHSRAFHLTLLRASGNQRLAEYVDGLRHLVIRRGMTTWARGTRTMIQVAESHKPLLEAFASGDPDKAAAAAADHLNQTLQVLDEGPPRKKRR